MKCLAMIVLALAAAVLARATAVGQTQSMTSQANPIRKVVNMLKAIQKKVEVEGDKEEQMYNKYMCYCKTSGGDLAKSVEGAGSKMSELSTDIEEGAAKKIQLDGELVKHKEDRKAAKLAVQEADKLREQQATEYAALKESMGSEVKAIDTAVAALEKGMGGSFLQTPAAGTLRRVVQASEDLPDYDRQQVVAFLASAQSSEYSPASGEIVGILKQLGGTTAKDLASATSAEEEDIQSHGELTAAKQKEIAAHTTAIEEKTVRVGELAVSVANMKGELGDTEGSLADDKKFLADLEKNCATKAGEWDEIVKVRAEEQVALAETITLLQSDDALELFKKALPSPAASFVQVRVAASTVRSRALGALRLAQRAMPGQPQLDLIALALHSKKKGFGKVLTMVDEMIDVLKKEQGDDDSKKEYCAKEFDTSDDKKKALEKTISDEEAAVASVEDSIVTVTEEMKALTAGIKALDKSVAEATEARKEENTEFTELMAQNTGAKQLLGLAKNRLNKFYNPTLVEPVQEAFLAQVSAHAAPPPPPETPGPYAKKTQATGGVIAMLDTLVNDLTKEMTVAETEEKDAQADYETMMEDSKEKRAMDSKSLSDKGGAKADAEAALQTHKDGKASASKELQGLLETISALHGECDWLLSNFDARVEARTGEIDALGNAKAVLSGADYSM